jgi:hypothetical protein
MPADLPSGYSAGTLTVAANQVLNLGTLIQQQVDTQASESATILNIQADSANAQPVLIGVGGIKLTTTNYGRSVAAGQTANYSSGAASAVPVGRLYVLSTATATLHIELLP